MGYGIGGRDSVLHSPHDGRRSGHPGAWYQVGIYLQAGGKLIGDCGFRPLKDEPRQAEVGMTLAPEFQRQGYAAEAFRALLSYLFGTLGKHRVFGSVDPANTASLGLLHRVGMRQEAHLVKSLWFRGDWVDDMIFALLEEEWDAEKSQLRSAAAYPLP